MTEFKKINDQLSVFGQISTADLTAAVQQGFKTVVNNRPDGEAEDQISNLELEHAAKALGLEYHYLPIAPAGIEDSQADQFASLFKQKPGPVLAFCRTGNRSTRLWALSHCQQLSSADILQQAQQAGYDISGLLDRINSRK